MTYTITRSSVSHPAFTEPMTHQEALHFARGAKDQAEAYPAYRERMYAASHEIHTGIRDIAKPLPKDQDIEG